MQKALSREIARSKMNLQKHATNQGYNKKFKQLTEKENGQDTD